MLVLTPLTPAGNDAFFELMTAMSTPAETNVVAITYTQPPKTWIANWNRQVGDLPSALTFIHANGAHVAHDSTNDPPAREDATILKVDPRELMDTIAPVTEHLTRWRDTGKQTVLSVQTLSILLEYVDLDTAFRYLYILTHRVQSPALGFYQMDPDIHDTETVNTLKTLFDAVVELHDGEWRVTETYTVESGDAQDTTDSLADSTGLFGALNRVLSRFSNLGGVRLETIDITGDDADDTLNEAASSAPTSSNDEHRPPSDMMSATSQICQSIDVSFYQYFQRYFHNVSKHSPFNTKFSEIWP